MRSAGLGPLILVGAILLVLACATSTPSASKPPGGGSAPAAAVSATAAPATAAPAAAAPTAGGRPSDPPLNPPVTVRVGAVGSASDAGIFIAQEKGYFAEQGIVLDQHNFQGLQQQVPLLGSGQLDVGGGGTNPGLYNAAAVDVPVRIVADKGSNLPGFHWQGFMVRRELVDNGTFQGCSSFKGLRVANAQDGNSAFIMLDKMIGECGLGLSDIESAIMSYADMMIAFRNGAIDASHMLEPNISRGVADGLFVQFKSGSEIYPGSQAAVLLYGPQFIANQRPAAERWMLAYVKGLRDYSEAFTKGTNKAEVIDILSRTTAVRDKTILERMGPTGLNPDGYVNVEALQYDLEWWMRHGYVRTPVTAAQVVDNSFADYAVARLGKHQP
jgi:NitT/TauT family transport system substrate-binding protein